MQWLKRMQHERAGQKYDLKYQFHHAHVHLKHSVQSVVARLLALKRVVIHAVCKYFLVHLIHVQDGVTVHVVPSADHSVQCLAEI
jgi:hypothetical protein